MGYPKPSESGGSEPRITDATIWKEEKEREQSNRYQSVVDGA
jgi:hypothetical protein